jgi:hypothetical protein
LGLRQKPTCVSASPPSFCAAGGRLSGLDRTCNHPWGEGGN